MLFKKAEFIGSAAEYKKCPTTEAAEFAFIGRSNVGKSSLINMLTGQKKLAKVSSTPGKTQLINHFQINDKFFLVDLPGYGYAKVSKTEKQKWGSMIHDYLIERKNLACLFILLDVRLEPQKIDLEFINWVGEKQIPLCLVFTKADKPSKNQVQSSVARYRKVLKTKWEEIPLMFLTSSVNKTGQEDLCTFMQEIDDNWK